MRRLSMLFLLILAVAVAEAVQVVGVLLVFTLVVAPPATAGYLARRPTSIIGLGVALAVLETWTGITLAYFTKYPVSFYIATLGFVLYALARLVGSRPRRRSADLGIASGSH